MAFTQPKLSIKFQTERNAFFYNSGNKNNPIQQKKSTKSINCEEKVTKQILLAKLHDKNQFISMGSFCVGFFG